MSDLNADEQDTVDFVIPALKTETKERLEVLYAEIRAGGQLVGISQQVHQPEEIIARIQLMVQIANTAIQEENHDALARISNGSHESFSRITSANQTRRKAKELLKAYVAEKTK